MFQTGRKLNKQKNIFKNGNTVYLNELLHHDKYECHGTFDGLLETNLHSLEIIYLHAEMILVTLYNRCCYLHPDHRIYLYI